MPNSTGILATATGTLLSKNEDASNYVTKARSIWMYTILELFKALIEKHPNPVNMDRSTEQLEQYYVQILDPIIENINDLKNREIKNIIIDTDQGSTENDDIDYFDLDTELSVTRIANPSICDICPDLHISETAFMESVITQYEKQTGIGFPYREVPVVTIYPSISGVFNFGKMYSQYVESSENKKRETYSTVIEISRRSILCDLSDILAEYNPDTKALSNQGLEILRTVVMKYTDFIVPMICINLRRDYHQYTNFLQNMYNNFCNNYQSSLRLQRYMYLIFNEVVKSPMGVNLAFLHATQFATSTIEFLNPEFKYAATLEELNNLFEKPYLTEYKKYTGEFHGTYIPLTEMYLGEIKAYSRIIMTNVNRIFDYIVTYFNTNGSVDKIESIQSLVEESFREMLGDMAENNECAHSILYTTIKNFSSTLRFKDLRITLNEISKKMNLATDITTPGVNSNRASLGNYPVIDAELQRRNYTFMGASSATTEGNDLIKEVFAKRSSNAVMNAIAARFENVPRYEAAMSLLIECKLYQDVFDLSAAQESAETDQFKLFLKNATSHAQRIADEYLVTE